MTSRPLSSRVLSTASVNESGGVPARATCAPGGMLPERSDPSAVASRIRIFRARTEFSSLGTRSLFPGVHWHCHDPVLGGVHVGRIDLVRDDGGHLRRVRV